MSRDLLDRDNCTLPSISSARELFLKAGFNLYPCGINKITKKPTPLVKYGSLFDGKRGETLGDLDNAKIIWCTVPSDIVVIDVDFKNFKEGEDPLKELMNIEPMLFAGSNFRVHSPGGLHIYYSVNVPNGYKITKNLKAYVGIDFVSLKSSIALPGSKKLEGAYLLDRTSDLSNILFLNPLPESIKFMILSREGTFAPPAPVVNTDSFNFNDVIKSARNMLVFSDPVFQGERNDSCFKLCMRLKDMGLGREESLTLLSEWGAEKCSPPIPSDEIATIIKQCYSEHRHNPYASSNGVDFRSLLQYGKDNLIKRNGKNLGIIIQYDKRVFNDEVYHDVFQNKKRKLSNDKLVDSEDYSNIRGKIVEFYSVDYFVNEIIEEIKFQSNKKKRHIVRERLTSCQWDGIKRLKDFAVDYLWQNDNAYSRIIGPIIFKGIVYRIFSEHGFKMEYLPVLIGPQRCGKSEFLKKLAIKQEWITDNFSFKKDCFYETEGKIIAEWAEMEGGFSSSTFKGYMSRIHDDRRRLYQSEASMHYRCHTLFATTNRMDFLDDPTGERRFLPIIIPSGRLIKLNEIEKAVPQLYAEAIHAFNCGDEFESILPKTEEYTIRQRLYSAMSVSSPVYELVDEYIKENKREFKLLEITRYIANNLGTLLSREDREQIKKALVKHGYVYTTKNRKTCYWPQEE